MHLNNPAGRLLNFILSGKKQDQKEITRTVLAKMFELDPGDLSDILKHYALILTLPNEIRE